MSVMGLRIEGAVKRAAKRAANRIFPADRLRHHIKVMQLREVSIFTKVTASMVKLQEENERLRAEIVKLKQEKETLREWLYE